MKPVLHSDLREAFGLALNRLMADSRVSTRTLAADLRVQPTAVRQWTEGGGIPRANYLVELSRYFGCSVDALLGLEPLT